jgi:DNA-nicking Smr family endonuclease
MRRRGLTPEDREVWAHVARTAKPMPGRKAPPPPPPKPEPAENAAPTPLAVPAAQPPKPRGLPPLATLEKRHRREVTRGSRAIDARIDLHGMRQAEAHQALMGFIGRAHHSEARLVLVITGKGGGFNALGEERGVLRRLVPHWLADPAMRRMILGYEPAGLAHGGDGALYVRIRRDRAHRES